MLLVDLLELTRSHLEEGEMPSSAFLCFNDALELFYSKEYEDSRSRALASLQYSIGVFHPDYVRASE